MTREEIAKMAKLEIENEIMRNELVGLRRDLSVLQEIFSFERCPECNAPRRFLLACVACGREPTKKYL